MKSYCAQHPYRTIDPKALAANRIDLAYCVPMNRSLSILQFARPTDVIQEPFPYLILENALPLDLCHELLRTYPSLESQGVDPSSDNLRWSTHAENLERIPNLEPIWREFISYHVSQKFFDQVKELFSDSLRRIYPDLLEADNSIFQQKVAIRNVRSLAIGRFSLDAQISGNTPAGTPGVPRGVHVDAPNALYGGLYYLRDNEDDSEGGDLQIWKWKDSYSYGKKSGEYREDVRRKHVELVQTIRYKANTLVFFLNSLDSLHSVTLRHPTPHTRKFVNFLADSDKSLFALKPLPYLRFRNVLRRMILER